MSTKQPKYQSGDHVRVQCDDGKWDEAWIVEVIPTYRYTICRKPHRDYKGGPLVGVFKNDEDIRPFDMVKASSKRTCKTCEHNKQHSCSHLYCEHGEDWTPKKETR